ncbi:WD40-repeat-containing domain protein [Cokeromyces recurvatus]|uniref:WD40-repeat-containing domain protein n=1 Tax=Cokeromyces recurvatus TaxID=90255 RepID=UPI00221F407D|nr:WD40-repeat-containing domain protein [Cokeromyces recurvatus]KAI7902932.1 WD40-repeat-containing domain protein [Cokeromyces recurvatus]
MPTLAKQFEFLPTPIQSITLFELLKRSSKSTLQLIQQTIAAHLKRDFLACLPYELKLHVISYLDVCSLQRASLVSKTWHRIINGDINIWYRLLMRDGFQIQLNNRLYREQYRRQYTLKSNWRKGRFRRIEFDGHKDNIVTCLQFDNDKIISGATDALINIYDAKEPQVVVTQLRGHNGGVWALQYIGNTLVSGSIDRTVRVWNIDQKRCTHIFKGHTSTVRCLQIIMPVNVNGRIEPQEPLIVTGSRDFSIRVWRLPNVEEFDGGEEPFVGEEDPVSNPWHKYVLVGHTHSVRSIAAYGNTLVSGSYDNTVAIWDLSVGRLMHRMEGHTSNVYSVVIDPPRNQCMSGSMDSSVFIWDLATGNCLHKLNGHSILVGLLGLTQNYLVSAAADCTLRVWNPNNGICEHVLAGHEGVITCFKHDDEKVISGSEGGLKVWDIKTGRYLYDLVTDVKGVWWVTFDKSKCVVAIHKYVITIYLHILW